MRILALRLALLVAIGPLSACAARVHIPSRQPPSTAKQQRIGYFDAHNHLSGILPYEAYADLPAFIAGLEGHGPGVDFTDEKRFYDYIENSWYPAHYANFDDKPFSSNLRYGLGARATLALYPKTVATTPAIVSGALQRILTATPYTEFDSAYAFRGDPGDTYLLNHYYHGNQLALDSDACKATILELAATKIIDSEQFMNFIGGWKFQNGKSYRLDNILCYSREPQRLALILAKMHESVPRINIMLMTFTSQLGESANGKDYASFSKNGHCSEEALPEALKTTPATIYHALLGENAKGQLVVTPAQLPNFMDHVGGIDTAGPELTCFSQAGMKYYIRLVDAVYRAAKRRRASGWQGKLLVHTHVGEGFSIYYGKKPPVQPWNFPEVFGALPAISGNEITDPRTARSNLSILLAAIARVEAAHPDIHRYLIFRLGHVTHATLANAETIARERVEADVNLDSNLSTGAYSISMMPDKAKIEARVRPLLKNPTKNLRLNNFPRFLMPNPADENTVAGVLGNASLKYLLMAHVRVMLGTDGAGVEHSSMPREYALAASLIKYWNAHDPVFRKRAGSVSRQTFFDNVKQHLKDMRSDAAIPYL